MTRDRALALDDDDMRDHETLPAAVFDAAGGWIRVSISPAAGSVRCPSCRALTAIDRCWNCGRRYIVTTDHRGEVMP